MAKHSRSFSFKLPRIKLPVLLIGLTVLVTVASIVLVVILLQKQPTHPGVDSSVSSVSSVASSTPSQSSQTVSLPVFSNTQSQKPASSGFAIQSYVPEEKVIKVEKWDELVFQRGGAATICIQAVPYTVYTLEIHPTGQEPVMVGSKKTDGNGNAIWNWTLDPILDGGEYPFVISGAGEREEIYVWIEEY